MLYIQYALQATIYTTYITYKIYTTDFIYNIHYRLHIQYTLQALYTIYATDFIYKIHYRLYIQYTLQTLYTIYTTGTTVSVCAVAFSAFNNLFCSFIQNRTTCSVLFLHPFCTFSLLHNNKLKYNNAALNNCYLLMSSVRNER